MPDWIGHKVKRVPIFSVIVPAYQAGHTIERCLRGIVSAGFSKDEILVVDDGSSDDTARKVKDFGIRMIANATPQRPAMARNRGVEAVEGDIVFFVDADVVLQGETRERLLRHFWNDGITAVIGSYDDRADGGSVVSDYRNLLHHHVHQTSPGISRTFWTGIGAVRRKAFLAAGGLQSDWENIEDVEFGLRLSAMNGTIVLDPEIQGTHLKVWTAVSMFKTDLFGRAIPWLRLIQAGRTNFGSLNTNIRHQLSAAGLMLALVGALVSLFFPAMLFLALIGLIFFVAGASDVLRMLRTKRGIVFAIRAIPWHMLHYCAGTIGYAVVRIEYLLGLHKAGKSEAG